MQNVGEHFNLTTFLEARKRTQASVRLAASNIRPGMNEAEAQAILDSVLQNNELNQRWHPPKFRIGTDTTKSFSERPDQNIRLKESDIFFIDIGPVYEDHEGDFGETFVIGEDEKLQQLAKSSKDIFQIVQDMWRHTGLSGQSLYEMAKNEAKKFGLELSTKMSGHRLAEFPHGKHHKGSLLELQETPKQHLWVMEILLKDPKLNLGSFYEDILL